MKKLNFVFCFIFCFVSLYSQTSQLGIVKEYREKNEKRPLNGVEIEIKFAQSTVSDKKGKFCLEFRTLTPGKKVNIRRIEKLGYEIFNKDALEQWNINPEEPFIIVMIRQEAFKKIKDHYSIISSKSYAEQHEREKQKLEQERINGKITEEKLKAELLHLDEWYESQLDNIENYVDRFARIDLSELSNEEYEIIKLIELGKLEEAILLYEQYDLLNKYRAEYDDQKNLLQAKSQIQKKIIEKNRNMSNIFAMIKRQISTYQISGGRQYFVKIDSLYANLVEINPNDLNICLSYLEYLAYQNEYDKALKLGEYIRDKESTESQKVMCVLYLAKIYLQKKNLAEAEKYSLQVLKFCDDITEEYYDALKILGAVYVDRDEIDNAKNIYERMLDLSKNKNERKVSVLEGLAALYHSQGEYEQAKQLRLDCLGVLDSLPIDSLELERKYFDIDEYEKWKAVVQLNLGLTYKDLGNLQLAYDNILSSLFYFRPAYEKNPDHTVSYLFYALNNLGIIYFERNEYEQSEEFLRQSLVPAQFSYMKDSVVYSDEYANALNNIAYINYVQKDYDECLDFYIQALDLRRKDYKRLPNINFKNELARVLINLASLSIDTQNYIQCIEYGKEALEYMEDVYAKVFEENYLLTLRLLSLANIYLKNKKESQLYLKTMYIISPNNPYVYETEGECFLIEGKIDKAKAMWQKVLKTDPDYLNSHTSTLYEKLKDVK